MPDLERLLADAVASPPPETHPPATIVRAAQRDRARRTALAVAVIAAAVVAVAGLGHGLTRDLGSAPAPGPVHQPPAGSRALTDAIPAEPGVDYVDVRSVRSDAERTQRFVGHTNDGGYLLERVVDDRGTFSVVGSDADVAELQPPPGGTVRPGLVPLVVDSRWEVWGDPSARELVMSVRDVASGTWFEMSVSLADLPGGAAIDAVQLWGGRIRVLASDPGARRAMLYVARVRPGARLLPGLPEDAVAVGTGGSKIAWVPVSRPEVVEVLDVDFDEPATLPLDLAEGCDVAASRSLATSSGLIAAWVQCEGGVAEVRTWRWDGRPGEVLSGVGVEAIAYAGDALVVQARDALYLLRPEDRLVRLVGRTATGGLDAWAGALIWDEAPDGAGRSRVIAVP